MKEKEKANSNQEWSTNIRLELSEDARKEFLNLIKQSTIVVCTYGIARSRAFGEVFGMQYFAYKDVPNYNKYSRVYCFERRHVKYIKKTGFMGEIINLKIPDNYTYEEALVLFKTNKIKELIMENE